jgi:hypothetical protein
MKLEKDVGIFDHFLSDDECDFFIELFKNKEKKGFVVNRQDSEGSELTTKADTSISINIYEEFDGKPKEKINSFIDNFWNNAFPKYAKKYPTLMQRRWDLKGFKIQKTIPGEGYHVWHDEHQLSYLDSSRVLTYIIYLNDEYEAGETEFLSKHMRITTKKGSLAIFPANYTHVHRGNPPLTGEKYILTGWVHDIGRN